MFAFADVCRSIRIGFTIMSVCVCVCAMAMAVAPCHGILKPCAECPCCMIAAHERMRLQSGMDRKQKKNKKIFMKERAARAKQDVQIPNESDRKLSTSTATG